MLSVGTTIHRRYLVKKALGSGGMGTTYLATDAVRQADVALKLVDAQSPVLLAGVRAEFELLCGVAHPHLCRVRDFGRIPGPRPYAFYSADYVAGTTLEAHAQGRSWAELEQSFAHALYALGFLHRLGIRHGDFKPGNVLVAPDGRGTLIDLGCSRLLTSVPTDSVSGTPAYWAPELCDGGLVDHRADLYAVGVTLRQLEPVVGALPDRLRRLVAALCQPSAAKRPSDIDEVLERWGLPPAPHVPSTSPATLIGRGAEMKRFELLLGDLLDHRDGCRALLLCGPPGVGRTRLAMEMKWKAQQHCTVVEAAVAHDRPVWEMLARATGNDAIPDGMAGVVAARRQLAAGREPIVLLVDDAQQLEGEQRQMWLGLVRTADRSDRLLILGGELTAPQVDNDAVEAVSLEPLGEPDVARWLGLVLQRRTDSSYVQRLEATSAANIARWTGGYPRSLHNLLALMSMGAWQPPVGDCPLPDEELSRQRIASFADLAAPLQRALAFVAAHGGTLASKDVDALQLDASALAELTHQRWVTANDAGYSLQRPSEASAIVAALEQDERRDVHRRLGELLANKLARMEPTCQEASRHAARAALHLCHAGLVRRVEQLFAGYHGGASAGDAGWIAAARALAQARPQPHHLLRTAQIVGAAGRSDEALAWTARVLRQRPQPSLVLQTALLAARAYLHKGALRRAERQLEKAQAIASSAAERAPILDLASRVHIKRGDWARALAAAKQGLELATEPQLLACLHDDVGVAASYLGDRVDAQTHLDEAATLHERLGQRRAQAKSASYRALLDYRAGETASAVSHYERALELADEAAASDLIANALLNLGTVSHQLGDFGQAQRCYERGLQLALALGDNSSETTLRSNLAKLYVDIGLTARAALAAESAYQRASSHSMQLLVAAAVSCMGEVALLRSQPDVAMTHFERARQQFAEGDARREVAECEIHVADALQRLGDQAEARARCAKALTIARSLGADDVVARALAMDARCVVRGELPGAIDPLEEAAALARGSQQRGLQAEVLTVLSEACLSAGAPTVAARHRQTACELWERCAATLAKHLHQAFWTHPLRADLRRPAEAPSSNTSPREANMARLIAINKKLNSSLDVSEVHDFALDCALELTGAERGMVVLASEAPTVRPNLADLRVVAMRNVLSDAAAQQQREFSEGIAARVIEVGEPVITVDAMHDPRFSNNSSVHAMRLRSVVCVPICAPAGVIGAVYLDHRFQRGIFEERDLDLLVAFADQVAIALTNAHLHRQLAQRTEQLAAERRRIEQIMLGQAEDIQRLTQQVRATQDTLGRRYNYDNIVGNSAAMQAVFRTLDRVTDSSVPLLLQGESGTGKELVAHAVHFNGPRAEGPFVTVNCAALPEGLLESQLFGYVRGAFTGADEDRQGLLVAADGGSIFLDELGEMTPAMQVKLLRVLQERRVQPVGSTVTVPSDFRVIGATNRELRSEVEAGTFREDLYYRLSVVTVTLPPLRERPEDIAELAKRIIATAAQNAGVSAPLLSRGALRTLMGLSWRGNVRELQNVLTRAVLMSDGQTLTVADLDMTEQALRLPTDRRQFEREERQRILAVLSACRWNVSEAVRVIGIPRATLYRKLKRYGLRRPSQAGQ